jgi:hypothetical protein
MGVDVEHTHSQLVEEESCEKSLLFWQQHKHDEISLIQRSAAIMSYTTTTTTILIATHEV